MPIIKYFIKNYDLLYDDYKQKKLELKGNKVLIKVVINYKSLNDFMIMKK